MSAVTTLDAPTRHEGPAAPSPQRMIVAWQHPDSRAILPVGVLTRTERDYTFAYLESVREIDGFRPLLGFRDFDQRYHSSELFHLFAQRVMSSRRPDYARYVTELGLNPEDFEPWEQLARSQGSRAVDRLQLFPVPSVVGGSVRCAFLVHGTRHVPGQEFVVDGEPVLMSLMEYEAMLSALEAGTEVHLLSQPENLVNPEALLVVGDARSPLGWVPDFLVHEVRRLQEVTTVEARVLRVNGAEASPHLRVLAELRAEGAEGFEFFSGPEWREIPASDQ
ncbi:hypothetical protein [Luteimicrobium sp. DT211]|uniref:hypothetical protein n=1 Tax=Luteimicrobium sp. DT211 TaxID=3393412 RepID=UPI003CFA3316